MTDTNIPPPAPPPATGRGVRIALAVSLALNLGVAGLAAGAFLHGGPGKRDMIRDMGFGPFNEALRPEDRDAIRQNLIGHIGDLRNARSEMQADATAILTALRAEPFVPAGLTAALAAQQQHLTDRLKLGSSVIEEFLVNLPTEDRLEFATRLEDHMRYGRDAAKP